MNDNKPFTLGRLFVSNGGFPHDGLRCSIKPLLSLWQKTQRKYSVNTE